MKVGMINSAAKPAYLLTTDEQAFFVSAYRLILDGRINGLQTISLLSSLL
jgi:hypothetical protein